MVRMPLCVWKISCLSDEADDLAGRRMGMVDSDLPPVVSTSEKPQLHSL